MTIMLPGPARWAIIDHAHDLDGQPYVDELTTEELLRQVSAIAADAVASAGEIGLGEAHRRATAARLAASAIRARHHETAVRWLAQLQITATRIED